MGEARPWEDGTEPEKASRQHLALESDRFFGPAGTLERL